MVVRGTASSDSEQPSQNLYVMLARWLSGQSFNNIMLFANFAAILSVLWFGAAFIKDVMRDTEDRHTRQIQQIVELCCGRRGDSISDLRP